MATSPMIGGSDPVILKSLETQTPSVARTSPATVNATTGADLEDLYHKSQVEQ